MKNKLQSALANISLIFIFMHNTQKARYMNGLCWLRLRIQFEGIISAFANKRLLCQVAVDPACVSFWFCFSCHFFLGRSDSVYLSPCVSLSLCMSVSLSISATRTNTHRLLLYNAINPLLNQLSRYDSVSDSEAWLPCERSGWTDGHDPATLQLQGRSSWSW